MQDNQGSGQYDVNDATLKFVRRRDDITLDDDPNILRAEMSCGHAVSPESLTAWCRSLLDQGQYKFSCPAITHGTEKCNAEWPYLEVRKLAVLSDSEQAHFEENMALMAASEYCEFKSCPSCGSYVEREDLTNLCVKCTICTSVKKKTYQFCWQCMREWEGAAANFLRCGYEDCVNPDVDKLTKCTDTRLSYVNNVECPAIRACPTCGLLLEHNGFACKNLMCDDTFKLHSVQVELEAVEKQIRQLLERQAELRAALESSRRHKDPSFDQFICSLSEERGKDSPSEMSLSQKQSVRSGSHVSSSVSVKSDCSKGRIPNFSEEQSRTKRIKEAALDFTLYFLREMEQDEAADTLEDELFFIHQLKWL
ncbi:hypothetical protein Q8A67_005469 [Cirrhinus molitorella]|uniref:RING-type domain-containing protein n=1 Tax=Cirrhinus molitorella TaxID=172907 RepID=A0AA88Q724_9TELE|nr:hypothetical protein Q8A67_005469 [Cirrhinus molitorella]